jgi:hypothetical protein
LQVAQRPLPGAAGLPPAKLLAEALDDREGQVEKPAAILLDATHLLGAKAGQGPPVLTVAARVLLEATSPELADA